jgi:hypothetical protein
MAGHRIRSAMFLDFDNVFSGLLDLDPTAALAFAQQPKEWLSRLAAAETGGSERRYLIRRCYMNPAGWRFHASLGTERVYFSRYRPFFTKAGFEVVDCPSLTYKHKNAADIRICLDAADTLRCDTQYDEYVIASGDADFTPLIQRLRAADRRVVVIASSQTAVAYESVADLLLKEQQLIELMTGVRQEDGEPTVGNLPATLTPASAGSHGESAAKEGFASSKAALARFREVVETAVLTAEKPLNLATLGINARQALGTVVDDADWFGHGTLTKAIHALGIPNVIVSGHYVWVEGRHESPDPLATNPGVFQPELIGLMSSLADLPRLKADVWPRLFGKLAEYARTNDYNMSDCTRWTRDELAASGFEVGRQAVSFVVFGALYGGCPMERDPPPTNLEIASAFLRNTLKRAAAAGLVLGDEEVRELRDWLHPEIPDDEIQRIDL